MGEKRGWASPERRRQMLRVIGLRIALVLTVTGAGLWYALSIVEAKKEVALMCRSLEQATTAEARAAIVATLEFSRLENFAGTDTLRLSAPWFPGAGQCEVSPLERRN